jgi:hypothetical protein
MTMKNSFWALCIALALLVAGCNKTSTRADADVAKDVQAKINTDSAVTNKAITVNSTNGTVTLSGAVANDTERMAAANDASAVEGVKQVVNNLTVGEAAITPPAAIPADNNPGSYNPPPARSSSRATTTHSNTSSSSHLPNSSNTTMPSNVGGTTAANSNSMATTTPPAPPVIQQVTVPAGTKLVVYLNDGLSSETSNEGDQFTGTIGEPVYINDKVAVPKNAQVSGRVVSAKGAAKFKGNSELSLQLSSLSYNGHQYRISSDTWSKQGAGRGKNTAAKVGGGAALGAIIGGIAGGGKGAAIGAGAGAAAGTGVQAITKGEKVELKPESMLQFSLQAPVTVTPSNSDETSREKMNPPSE